MSPAQQRGIALWAALLSAVVCLGFLPVSRLVSVLVMLAMIGLIIAFWYIGSRRAEPDVTLHLDDLPEATYRQPVVLVCGDLPLTWPQSSPVLTVTQGCWIRVEDHQDLEQVARQVLWLRPDWGRQLSVMVSVCPQKHADSERLTSRLLALRWQISQLRKETGHSVPLVLNGQVGSAMTNDMLWQAAIAGEGMRVWRESSAPSSIAAWVTTGGSPAMQQQVLMNSLMGWFHKHVKAVFMDENPDVPVIAPVAVLWGMGPILAGSLATSVWTAWLSRHTAMQRVTGWQPVGTDSTVISPFPDFILPLLPEGSGLTSQARTWRCVLSLFTLAAIAALLSSGWNNRQLLHRVSFDISKEMMLMKSGSLTLQAPVDQGYGIKIQQPLRVIQGVVTGFERLGTSRDETHYALTLRPRLALLDRSHQNAIYQDMSVPQIVEKILRERHGMRGQDFLFSLTREYPRREQVMQYGENDLHFITRLLGEVGIWFRFTTDTRLNIDVVEFYDGQQGYEKGLTLPSVPPSGQHSQGVDAVWGMESHHSVVQKQVSTRDYNYRQATQDMNAQVDVTRGDTTTYGEAYHYADNYLTPGIAYERHPAPESGAFYARIRHERYLNGQTQARAITSSPALSPGQVLKVTGGYEVAEVFARGVVITAMRSHARRDEDFCIHFDGIPDSADFSFRPEPGPRPVMAGTLPARVTSTTENDTYGHIDKDGRYRVNMLFDRDSWETGFESLWVRQSRPYAGDTYGLHLPLLAGTGSACSLIVTFACTSVTRTA